MKIDGVRIRDFRCFNGTSEGSWSFTFRPGRASNLIIGRNGVGKTALIDAIDLVLNAEGRANRSLVSEYDFVNGDTCRPITIEVTLVDIGHALHAFESDIQWITPDGAPVDGTEVPLDESRHERAVVIRFEAAVDPEYGEVRWSWSLPKFPATELEQAKELARQQHDSLGYFRITPTVTRGSFTMGSYSALGRHLRSLQYRLGRLPEILRTSLQLPECSIEKLACAECQELSDCLPVLSDDNGETEGEGSPATVGSILGQLAAEAKSVLGVGSWDNMLTSLGPRYGGLERDLGGLTLGLRTPADKFIPFEQLSAGEKYAFSFALSRAKVPGDRPPLIVMEEPETALYPSSVSRMVGDLQAAPSGEAPQVLVTTHSESVLRCFRPDDVITLGADRKPRKLGEFLSGHSEAGGPSTRRAIELLIMPGGPSALLADKVLVVEGAGEAVVSGYLDRLAATISARGLETVHSFSSLGWCVLAARGARTVPEHAKLFADLGRSVAVLLDNDDSGRSAAEQCKLSYPTFTYQGVSGESKPTLEDALLLGLRLAEQEDVLKEFFGHDACGPCDQSDRHKKCWKRRACIRKEDRWDHKTDLQRISLDHYEARGLFPPVFRVLLDKLDATPPGDVVELPIEAPLPLSRDRADGH